MFVPRLVLASFLLAPLSCTKLRPRRAVVTDKLGSLPDELLTKVQDFLPSSQNLAVASHRLRSSVPAVPTLSLTRQHSRQYLEDEDFQESVDANLEISGKVLRLNLGDLFCHYLENAKFRKSVNSLVDTPLEQIWSDVKVLYLSGTKNLKDISPIAALPKLENLSIHRTKLSNLAPLAGMKSLKSLSLCESQITDISPLATCTNLEDLSLSDSPLRDIRQLAALTNLKHLGLDGTKVTDVSALADLTNLRFLWLTGTPVNNISALDRLPLLAIIS